MGLTKCRLCHGARVELVLDLGPQALSNRFLASPSDEEARFRFVLGQCRSCGIVQLVSPVPALELKPRVDWISYREAEGHLDELVDEICKLPGLDSTSTVGAVSAKDDSTVARLRARGFSNGWRLDIEHDFGIEDRGAGPETVQHYLVPVTTEMIAKERGAADVLIARHVVEHAHEPATFVAALRKLVKPDGYIVLEVPDCEPALQRTDYTMPWEDHVLYFTADLLRQAVGCWGLSPISYRLYPYSHENSLVAIVRSPATERTSTLDATVAERVAQLGKAYARAFPAHRQTTTSALDEFRRTRGRVAVFGAGHLSCAWINFLELRDHLDFVAEDHPRKRGRLMPGSHLPILASSELVAREIKLCLLSLNQESEARVIKNNRAFIAAGGTFASIFPGRANSLLT